MLQQRNESTYTMLTHTLTEKREIKHNIHTVHTLHLHYAHPLPIRQQNSLSPAKLCRVNELFLNQQQLFLSGYGVDKRAWLPDAR